MYKRKPDLITVEPVFLGRQQTIYSTPVKPKITYLPDGKRPEATKWRRKYRKHYQLATIPGEHIRKDKYR